jgi:DNA-binding SARP family transcriptional activator
MSHVSDVVFRALGPLEVIVAGRSTSVDAPRQQVVLCMLLLGAGRPVPMEQIIDAIWADGPPSTARSQVQICISALRRSLGTSLIVTHPVGYSLRPDGVDIDLVSFEQRLAAGRAAVAAGRYHEAVDSLRSALSMWRGPALAGIPSRSLEATAARLDEQRLTATEELIEIELSLGRHRELTSELMGLVSAHPLRERLLGYLMVALYRSGRQAEALQAYRAARRDLIEELGLEPSEPLRRLEHAILSQDADLELAHAEPAVARSGAAAYPDIPQQLPADIADFTGRPGLVKALVDRILTTAQPAGPAVPIFVISGPGGVGKTTMAVRVGHSVRSAFPDGQLFANLRGSQQRPAEPAEILARFLRALGVGPESIGSAAEERAETYRSVLADRRVLIVLDDAAEESQLLPLLPGTPGCTVIVTSRHRLGALPGGRATDVEVLDHTSSVGLLAEIVGRSRVAAAPRAVAALATLCGGLPLALRIVGARLAARPHWQLETMVERLADEQSRLDELAYGELGVRATLQVTYLGLSERARMLFRLLGLIDAPHFAEWTAVVLLGDDPLAAGAVVDELVDVWLLEIERDGGQVRYRFHDLVRVFARERLRAEEAPADEMRALVRLVGGYLTLVEEAHRAMYGGDYTVLHGTGQRWRPPPRYLEDLLRDPLAWFEAERPALLAAVRQAADADLDELCWDLAVTAVTLFEARGYYDDWRTTHELALAATRRAGNLRGEAATLCSLGSLGSALRGGDDRYRLDRALHLFQRVGEQLGTSLALRNLAHLDHVQGRLDEAIAGYRQALAGFRSVDDRVAEAHVLGALAQVYLDRGELAEAEPLLQQSLRVSREIGNARVSAQNAHRIGDLLLRQNRLTEAEATFREVLDSVERIGDRVGQVYALTGLGLVYTALRRFGPAEELLLQAYELWREVGGRQAEARVLLALGRMYTGKRDLARAEEYVREAVRASAAQQSTIWQAWALNALGEVHALVGQLPAAITAWKQASALAPALAGEFASVDRTAIGPAEVERLPSTRSTPSRPGPRHGAD